MHARRAAELFQQVANEVPSGQTHYFGLSLERLIGWSTGVASGGLASCEPSAAPVEIVFPFVLQADESGCGVRFENESGRKCIR